MSKLKLKFREVWRAFRNHGISGGIKTLKYSLQSQREKLSYRQWVHKYDTLNEQKRDKVILQIKEFAYKPLISVVMPVYNIDEKWLRLAIESVRNQIYPFWEFCIADDCSPAPHIRQVLEEYVALDSRIKVVFRTSNGHISAASNSALELATGDFCALLDHDDELAEDALFFIAAELNRFPDADFIYSDEDLIDECGNRSTPKFKPDFSLDLLYSLNLITHLSVYRTAILRDIGGFRAGFEGSQDYDLALRFIEKTSPEKIIHIPRVLYHWRTVPGSVALAPEEKNYAHERARTAIYEHFVRTNIKADVVETFRFLHRVQYHLPAEGKPLVSIIVTGDWHLLRETVEKILSETSYSNFEVLLDFNEKFDDKRVIIFDEQTSSVAEKCNFLASKANGEILCFFQSGLKIKEPDWLLEMVRFGCQPRVGAVGAKLLYQDNTVRHAGVILGINGICGNAHENFPADEAGNLARARLICNYSAVSGACLLVRSKVFRQIEGFDSKTFPNGLFDIDLCLRLHEKGFRNVLTPYAEIYQTTAAPTEKLIDEYLKQKQNLPQIKLFKQKWKNYIENDPFYNPNLSLISGSFLVALPARQEKINF